MTYNDRTSKGYSVDEHQNLIHDLLFGLAVDGDNQIIFHYYSFCINGNVLACSIIRSAIMPLALLSPLMVS